MDSFLFLDHLELEFYDFYHIIRIRLVSPILCEYNSVGDSFILIVSRRLDWSAIWDFWACSYSLLLSSDGIVCGNLVDHAWVESLLWIAVVIFDGENAA